jgi:SAM-dependent methyltransferase
MNKRDSEAGPRGVDLAQMADYFTRMVDEHGPTAKGVGYSSDDRQLLRFKQLAACMMDDEGFTVLDVGCGYGAFWDYLHGAYKQFDYLGLDVSPAMIGKARKLHQGTGNCRFSETLPSDETADYVVASGIFNVMFAPSRDAWWTYVSDTLTWMFGHCRKAMACNFLTTYSDVERRSGNLYYAEPSEMLDFCIRNLSKDVRLIHHYGIWDFTVHVLRNT